MVQVDPLHVSGHGCRDEQREMLELVRPKYFIPIYAGALHRNYHAQLAKTTLNLKDNAVFMLNNGDMLTIDQKKIAKAHQKAIASGSVLVDDVGQIIPSIVIKDRLLLTSNGLVVVILTVNRFDGRLVSSPDIVTRGFIHIKDNEELMNLFRNELKRAINQRFNRIPLDRFKVELKDHITHFLYNQTQRSPIVIPVINIVDHESSKITKRPISSSNLSNIKTSIRKKS